MYQHFCAGVTELNLRQTRSFLFLIVSLSQHIIQVTFYSTAHAVEFIEHKLIQPPAMAYSPPNESVLYRDEATSIQLWSNCPQTEEAAWIESRQAHLDEFP